MAAKAQIERPAILCRACGQGALHQDLVLRKRQHHVEQHQKHEAPDRGLGEVETEVEQPCLVFGHRRAHEFADTAVQAWTMKPIAKTAPPILTTSCTMSVQTTALHAAERGVDDGEATHQQNAPRHIDAGDGGDGQRRQEQDHAHTAAQLGQDEQAAGQHADGRVEAGFQIREHRHQVEPAQQGHDPHGDEHQPDHGNQVVGHVLPIRFERLCRNGDVADRTGVGGVKTDTRSPEWNRPAADEKVRRRIALFAQIEVQADANHRRQIDNDHDPVEPAQQQLAGFDFGGREKRRATRRPGLVPQQAGAPGHGRSGTRSVGVGQPGPGSGDRVHRQQGLLVAARQRHQVQAVGLADGAPGSRQHGAWRRWFGQPSAVSRPAPQLIGTAGRVARGDEQRRRLRQQRCRCGGTRPCGKGQPRRCLGTDAQLQQARLAGAVQAGEVEAVGRDRTVHRSQGHRQCRQGLRDGRVASEHEPEHALGPVARAHQQIRLQAVGHGGTHRRVGTPGRCLPGLQVGAQHPGTGIGDRQQPVIDDQQRGRRGALRQCRRCRKWGQHAHPYRRQAPGMALQRHGQQPQQDDQQTAQIKAPRGHGRTGHDDVMTEWNAMPSALRPRWPGALQERRIDHLAVDDECAAACAAAGRGIDHALRRGQLVCAGAEDCVGRGDLARVDATLADVAQALRHLRFRAEACQVLQIGKSAIAGEDAGRSRRHAHRVHRRVDVVHIAARDAQRLEQIAQTQLAGRRHAGARRRSQRRAAGPSAFRC